MFIKIQMKKKKILKFKDTYLNWKILNIIKVLNLRQINAQIKIRIQNQMIKMEKNNK
jgi:hypothetical protein